jgi:hypothetical protein
MSCNEIECHSSDGSDSEGSLVDFIVKNNDSEDEVESEVEDDTRDEVTQLVEDFPFEKSLLEEDNTGGPRRSRRNRKNVVRYQDPNYGKLMYDDVDVDKISDSDDEENNKKKEEEEDFTMEEDSDDETDDSEYED